VLEAFGLGALAQASLLLAGLAVFWITVPRQIVGILAGFGAGGMIAAVSFDLVPEAQELANWQFALWMLVGVAVFLIGDWLVDKRFGDTGAGGAMGIVVGSVVDGVPESLIFGIQIGTAFPVSASFIAAVFISNIPQALAPSADLASAGWDRRRLGLLWFGIVVACGVAAALGYLVTDVSGAATGDRAAALAAGGLLAMLTNSLVPFAFERGRSLAGPATAIGFCLAAMNS
jgi:zinc transporter, ZIP family